MSKNRLVLVGILLLTSFLAVAISFLLTKSETLGMGAYGAVLGVTMIFVEPFTGLLNYLLFLYLRPQEFIPGFIGMPIMLMISGLTAGFTLIHMAVKRDTLGLRRMPQNYLVLWFFAAILLSHMSHLDMAGTSEAANYILPVIILYYLVATLVTSERKLGASLTLIMLMTLFLAGQGIYQYFTGVGIAGQELFQNRIVSIGIFSDPNDLALAMLLILPFPVLLFADTKSLLLKVIYALFALTLAITVFFTESRGGILSLGLLMLLVVWRRYGPRFGIAMGVVMAAVIFVMGPSRMSEMSTQEASAHARVASWTVAFDLLQWYPLFGVGQGRFTSYHPKTAHNSVLLAAGELGFFGLLPWMILFYISVKNLRYVKRYAAEAGRTRLALYSDAIMLGLIGFFSGAMFLSRTYNPLLFTLFGLAAAATGIFVSSSKERYALFEKKDWRNGVLFTIGTLIMLKIFLFWAW
jgi:putative inorganic carbon (HCO3(-)) transporter